MKLVENYLGGKIVYGSLVPSKKTASQKFTRFLNFLRKQTHFNRDILNLLDFQFLPKISSYFR